MLTILLCPPKYFDIKYKINPWMDTRSHVDRNRAEAEWQTIREAYVRAGHEVHEIEPIDGLPDMVFATDSCLMVDGKIMLARFRYSQRQPEAAAYEHWLLAQGYTDIRQTQHYFEGGGESLVMGETIFAGYGFRSELESHDELRDYFERKVVSLRLVDERYYHLDTAMAVLDGSTAVYFPEAFDSKSRAAIEATVPNLIIASSDDAAGFGLNAFSDGQNVFMGNGAPHLAKQFRAAGFTVHELEIDEFLKAGGGVKCMTLTLRHAPERSHLSEPVYIGDTA